MSYSINRIINTGDLFKITKPNGDVIYIEIDTIGALDGNGQTDVFTLKTKTHNFAYDLNWHNCYSFGNGVESTRVRDDFNKMLLAPGVRVSAEFDDYKKEERKNSLIYSGIYNKSSSFNETNQFNLAEKITKDLNPTYGSIQKLHTRDSDLTVLCEDKVLKVLANKDALFNADGNIQLLSNERVLGQAIPYVGDYGISQNPESFVSEAYRSYFTDKQRGAVLRLSRDGLSPISLHGMKDYFKDNLKTSDLLIGGYDKKKDQYNLTLNNTTVSFQENVRGWTSFKSYVPESSVSCSSDYYTFDKGQIYLHHDETVNRNRFYNIDNESEITLLFNDAPSSIKNFETMSYEGTQAKIAATEESIIRDKDDSYYNLEDKPGWYLSSLSTDKNNGVINEFIEKEGKWFNYIKGDDTEIDYSSNQIQGIGIISQDTVLTEDTTDPATGITTTTVLDEVVITFDEDINTSLSLKDTIHYVVEANIGNGDVIDNTNLIQYSKPIKSIGKNTITVEHDDTVNPPATIFEQGDFVLFTKDSLINKSGVVGYYAEATFKNSAKNKAELFSASSEINESSK
tara:strand:+ start:317 stop:2023 length:1707 start_codon:yes stop_codon:yes gene_type:complete